METYRSPGWLAGEGPLGGHLQTIWPALFSARYQGSAPNYRRERWTTPDDDFIDVDWQEAEAAAAGAPLPQRPLLVMFHGLEGSSRSHYAQAFAHWAREQGWHYAVPHFRGCSGEMNLAPRAYHSGDHEEIGWILQRMRARHDGPLLAVGVSLGGNALLRWAEEAGSTASACVRAVAAVSAPLDLAAGGEAIGRGVNRQIYTRMFLKSMLPKALKKAAQFPGLLDTAALHRVRDLYQFDNAFTAPLHGFRSTEDYWARCSSKPHLHCIQVPALVVNARNDPFVPGHSLPAQQEVGDFVTLWQPPHGGHVGFPRGRWPGHVLTLPEQVMGWMTGHAQVAIAAGQNGAPKTGGS
ncbi:MAG: YheT family hydrolase [Rhizobacter sp.]